MLAIANGDDERPRLDFGRGRFLRHVLDDTFEWILGDGRHVQYIKATSIVYEPTLTLQRLASRVK